MVKIFYDLETTGVNILKHSVHQIAGFVEVDGEIVQEFDIKTAPHPKAEITKEALSICGKTAEELRSYQPMGEAYTEFAKLVRQYVNDFDKTDKAILVGFNNRYFDDQFLRAFFKQNGSNMFDIWFFSGTLDVMVLAAEYLQDRRASMPSFKLKRVAKELGIRIDEEKLHDAFYDVRLTYDIYRIVTYLQIEGL